MEEVGEGDTYDDEIYDRQESDITDRLSGRKRDRISQHSIPAGIQSCGGALH